VSSLLDQPFSSTQMTYDLRRLRLKGLITRIARTNRYTLIEEGLRFAVTYTKLGRRLLPPLLSANQPPAPRELQRASTTIDHHADDYLAKARLSPAACNLPQNSTHPEQRFSSALHPLSPERTSLGNRRRPPRPSGTQEVGSSLGLTLPREDPLAIPLNAHRTLFGREVSEVPNMFTDNEVEPVKDSVISLEELTLELLSEEDGRITVEPGHSIRPILGHEHGLAESLVPAKEVTF
jgi:hypothetical protein